jgi:hypothetical protein
MKNAAAVALGKRRARTMTSEERAAGGRAAWANLTDEERSAEMRRRAKRRKKAR